MGLDTKTYGMTDCQSQCDFDFDKFIITKMFAPLDKAKPVTEIIRRLNLAAVKHMTVKVTRLPL
jgi:hypothetical protein